MSIFKGRFRSRDKPPTDYYKNVGGGFVFGFGGTSAGKAVNERTAMQTSAVYACVKVISETVASLPLHVYKRIDGDDKQKAYDHPLYNLLHLSPNPDMTAYTFIETALTHLLLWGNSYSQVIRDGRGYPTALYPLMPNKMSVERDSESGEIAYFYSTDKGQVKLTRQQVLHVPGLGFDGLIGYSPVAMAKQAVGLSIAAEEYGAAFFQNGANPGGVITHPNTIKDIPKLRENWNAQYGGSGKVGKVAILEEGMQFQALTIPPEQAQFLQTRRYQLEEIARLYRVPLHMVGDLEHATFSNVEHLSLDFTRFTLTPWLTRIEQAIEKSLLFPSEQASVFVRFAVDGLLRGDFKTRMEGYAIGIQNGFMSPNEVRSLEDMNRIPAEIGGDKYLVNGSLTELCRAGEAYNKQSGQEEQSDGKQTESKTYEVLELGQKRRDGG